MAKSRIETKVDNVMEQPAINIEMNGNDLYLLRNFLDFNCVLYDITEKYRTIHIKKLDKGILSIASNGATAGFIYDKDATASGSFSFVPTWQLLTELKGMSKIKIDDDFLYYYGDDDERVAIGKPIHNNHNVMGYLYGKIKEALNSPDNITPLPCFNADLLKKFKLTDGAFIKVRQTSEEDNAPMLVLNSICDRFAGLIMGADVTCGMSYWDDLR